MARLYLTAHPYGVNAIGYQGIDERVHDQIEARGDRMLTHKNSIQRKWHRRAQLVIFGFVVTVFSSCSKSESTDMSFLALLGGAAGGEPTAIWARSVVEGAEASEFRAVTLTADGSLYAVGYQEGSGTYSYSDAVSVQGASVYENGLLIKFNGDGVAQWARSSVVGTRQSEFNAIAIDGAGNIYVAGQQTGTGTFQYGAGVSATGSSTYENALIVKYSPDGEAIWAKSPTGSGARSAFYGLAIDGDGNVYAAGYQGQSSLDYGNGVSVDPGSLTNAPVLVKFDPSGDAIWGRSTTAGPNASAAFHAVAMSGSDVVVVGYQYGNSVFQYGAVNATGAVSNRRNALLISYSNAGTAQWARSVFSGTDESSFDNVSVDSHGRIYAAGYQTGSGRYTYDAAGSVGVANSTSYSNNIGALLVRYSSDGTADLALGASSEQYDARFRAISVDESDSIITAGSVECSNVGVPCQYMLRKSSSAGSLQWTRTSVPTFSNWRSIFYGVAAASNGDIIAVGHQFDDRPYSYGAGVEVAGSSNDDNAIIVRFRP
ncbi:hypothetical protein Lepil_1762 [Leptonema illini DSM 21528]|uniref:Beta-propeller repeat protein n=3 Tax=Leptonema illini TaxID=183 RepID=H2CCX5_9LEPT|nr:hypothetical protein Lepil_1762 [Leptonema illini DSM 21528]